jgi:tRNA dimethylallyltransferase
MDAARWAEMASRAIDDVRARGRRPMLCGGTFLWTKALLFGLADAPAADEALRARHRAVADAEGRPALHARLRQVDAASAARLHPNDFVRVSRALEVFELTGKPMSAWQAEHAFARPRGQLVRGSAAAWSTPDRAILFAVSRTREELTARIEERVRGFFAAGWIDETRALLDRGYGNARAMAAVGYKEVRAHLEGKLDEEALAPAVVRATRVFARRQRTWLKSAAIEWL